jgi:NAD(P)H-dependent flavin oxidoreductase YrpB (nitropropane dioxygenase family)
MADTLHRLVCDLLGCSYPIVLAGLGGVAQSELAATVTKGRGFGFLGVVREPVDLIASELSALRARGIERFGVNLIPRTTDPALLEEQVSACCIGATRFLNRGQGWVVRKLKALLPTIRDEAIHADLAAMLVSNETNIELVTAQLPAMPFTGVPHER